MNRTVFTAELGFKDTSWKAGFRGARSDISGFQRQVAGMNKTFSFLERGFGRVTSVLDKGLAKVRSYARVLRYTLSAALSYATYKGLKFNSQFEDATLGFTSLLGSQSKAKAFMKDLQKISDGTPLRFTEVMKSAQTMLGFEMSADRTKKTLTALNQAIIATGGGAENFQQAALALGQLSANGIAAKEELNQLVTAGVPVNKILQQELGLTGQQVAKIGNEAISSDKVIDAITRGWTKKFRNSAKEAQGSWTFLTGSMRKDWERFMRVATQPLFEKLRVQVLPGASKFIKDLSSVFASASSRHQGIQAYKVTWNWITDSFQAWLNGGGEEKINNAGKTVGSFLAKAIMTFSGANGGAGDNPFFQAGKSAFTGFINGFKSNIDVGDLITSPLGKALGAYMLLKFGPSLGKKLLGGILRAGGGAVGGGLGDAVQSLGIQKVYVVNMPGGGIGGGIGDVVGGGKKGWFGKALDRLSGPGKVAAVARGGVYTLAAGAGAYAGWNTYGKAMLNRHRENEIRKVEQRSDRNLASLDASAAVLDRNGNAVNAAVLRGQAGRSIMTPNAPLVDTNAMKALRQGVKSGLIYGVRDPKFPGGIRAYGGKAKPENALSRAQIEAYDKGMASGSRDPVTGNFKDNRRDSTLGAPPPDLRKLARTSVGLPAETNKAKASGKAAGRAHAAGVIEARPAITQAWNGNVNALNAAGDKANKAANAQGRSVSSQFGAGITEEQSKAITAVQGMIKGVGSAISTGLSSFTSFFSGSSSDGSGAGVPTPGTGDAPSTSAGAKGAGRKVGALTSKALQAKLQEFLGSGGGGLMGGGIGITGDGDWAGSKPIIMQLAQMSGLPITSTKRAMKMTASGNMSDHYIGNRSAFAADLGASPSPQADATAQRLAAAMGGTWVPGQWMNVTRAGYRMQLGWRVPGHFDHIHIGARKLHGGGIFNAPSRGGEGLALLRDGERVIPRSGAHSSSPSRGSVSVSITGNTFVVRNDDDIAAVAQQLADYLSDVMDNS